MGDEDSPRAAGKHGNNLLRRKRFSRLIVILQRAIGAVLRRLVKRGECEDGGGDHVVVTDHEGDIEDGFKQKLGIGDYWFNRRRRRWVCELQSRS